MSTALLLSGGMDSIAIAYWQKPELAITINYGQQSAQGEIRAASACSVALGIEHCVITADLRQLGSGDMAETPPLKVAPVSEWWPYRNQMLVTLAAMKAISLGIERILIGTVKTDSHHADGRGSFVDALSALLCMQEGAITLEAPGIEFTSEELIRQSGVPMELLGWSHSCHVGKFSCGLCRGCRKHYETMRGLGGTPY